ncbi:rpsF [Mucuna pruriens]|uniref:RpsF n=1 Tax=Mucuna pruriens TaxID=157652 RepID=A0A371F9W2_MUCPR|nr:rpsF [Mucuna pruriens]
METQSLLQCSSPTPSYLLPKLSKTTMMTTNCVSFNFTHNPCLIFANCYPSSFSLPLSVQNKPRKAASSLIVSARKKDKKEDAHYAVPKPDEGTSFFPEAVLLKKRTVEEDGRLLPEFEDADERQLFESLMLELDSDMNVEILRHYEVVYLIHEKHEDEVAAVNQKVQDFLREKKGQVWRLNDWGMRRLAYKIKKANNAHYMLMNFELDAKYINDFKTLLDQDERVIRHLVIKRDEAITKDCPPPPEFHTLRANADDIDDEESDEDYDSDWDGEDEVDDYDADEGGDEIIVIDGDDEDIDSRNETSANVREPEIRKLSAENVGMQSSSKRYAFKYRRIYELRRSK